MKGTSNIAGATSQNYCYNKGTYKVAVSTVPVAARPPNRLKVTKTCGRGIADEGESADADLIIYPNPSTGKFTRFEIDGVEDGAFKLYDDYGWTTVYAEEGLMMNGELLKKFQHLHPWHPECPSFEFWSMILSTRKT